MSRCCVAGHEGRIPSSGQCCACAVQAFQHVYERRQQVCPNLGFLGVLIKMQRRLLSGGAPADAQQAAGADAATTRALLIAQRAVSAAARLGLRLPLHTAERTLAAVQRIAPQQQEQRPANGAASDSNDFELAQELLLLQGYPAAVAAELAAEVAMDLLVDERPAVG